MSTHILPRYRIAVVGSGAVGCYYGAKLAHLGRDVHFLMRSDLATVRRKGLWIRSREGDIRVPKVNAHATTAEIGPCDLVIVALKATSNGALDELVPPLLHADTMLLTLQNGLGNEEYLAARFGAERVLGGLCFVCLNRTGPGVIEHYAEGRIGLGEFTGYPQPRTHEVASEFKRCGVPCTVTDNLMRERWRKLVWNIPFNGLSIAAGGIDTRAILESEPLRDLARALMREVIAAAGTLGCVLPDSLADDQIEKTKGMGPYKPSSLIDHLEGRAVEVEAIWGEPLRRALAAGAEADRLEMLWQLLRHLATAASGGGSPGVAAPQDDTREE